MAWERQAVYALDCLADLKSGSNAFEIFENLKALLEKIC